ncbi:retrovirus-related pol polyprotein from transposon TNT 1-94 [Tanacetum coccineum]
MNQSSQKAKDKGVPSAGQSNDSPAEEEKNTYSTTKEANLKNDLADLMGIDVVEEYHKKKLLYDKYFDKMLKRRKSPKITNCDVLTKKRPYHTESSTSLSDRKEKRWKTIYGLIKTRIEYLNQTEKELKIDFNKPLKEQDPLNELNDLANKKRKRTDDLKDHSRYKALMNELVNDGIKLSKLEINTGFIKVLPKKWLSFCQSLKNTNHVKDSELASLCGKLKYKGNLIDNIYETEKNKSLVFATPLSTAFISTTIVQDFQDSPDDEEDTRSSHEISSAKATNQTECHKCGKKGHFARDCWSKASDPSYQSPFQPKPLSSSQHKPELRPTKEFEAKYNKVKAKLALLSSSALASIAATVTNKGLIAKACEWDEEEVSSDDNEIVEVKVLMELAEENDVVSKEGARNGEWVKISMRKVHTLLEMEDNDDIKTYLDYLCIDLNYVEEQRNNLLSKHIDLVHELNACKEQLLVLKQEKLDFLTMHHVNTEILKDNKNLRTELKELTAITKTWLNSSNKLMIQKCPYLVLSEAEGFILPNHNTGRILPTESQRNTTGPLVAVTDSSAIEYDSTDESSVCSTPLPPLKKLDGAEPISGPKTIKSILRSKYTFKAETLKCVTINEPSSAPAKGNKISSASKVNSAPTSKLMSVKIEDDPPLAIVMKELNNLKLQIRKNQSSYSRNNQQCKRTDHRTCDHAEYISIMNMIISLEREINPRNPQHAFKRCEACGSSTHTTTNQYDIELVRRGEELQAKKAEALKSSMCDIRKSIWYLDSGCSRHMTGVKSYMHKYVEQSGPKVVFRDNSTCTTEGYGSIKCNGIVFTKVAFVNGLKYNLISISQLCDARYIVQFDEKRGTIFNSNKEVVMIAPRVRDVYVLDMTSSAQESCFSAESSKNLN